MDAGEALVRASIWLAVALYPSGAAARLWHGPWPRAVWTIGCVAFWIHAGSAFHVHYAWSHAVALRETARLTAELVGREVGAGIYFNYLVAMVWLGDAVWWWLHPESHEHRARWLHLAEHTFLLSMVFFGGVVFAHGPIRWLSAMAILLAAAALIAPATKSISP